MDSLTLRHLQLDSTYLLLPPGKPLLLKVAYGNELAHSYGQSRKFIFILEETEEETPPLDEASSYTFKTPLLPGHTYHLLCANYPSLKCLIEVERKKEEPEQLSPLKNTLAAVKEEDKEEDFRDCTERESQVCEDEDDPVFEVYSAKSDSNKPPAERDFQQQFAHSLQNQYIKYFEEEVKIWSTLFQPDIQHETQHKIQTEAQHKIQTETQTEAQHKAQTETQHKAQTETQHKTQSGIEHDLKQLKMCVLENKAHNSAPGKGVGSGMESEISRFECEGRVEKEGALTETSLQRGQGGSFVEWANEWAEGKKLEEVSSGRKGDKYLIVQWFGYLRNRFKVSQLLHT